MITVTVSTNIDRPTNVVFDYVADVSNSPAWNSDVLEVSRTSADPTEPHSTFRLKMKPAMGVSEAELELSDVKPNTKLVRKIRFGRMRSTHTSQFVADGEATVYTERIEVSMGGGLLGLLEPLFKRMVRARNVAVLESLKRNLEQT